MSTQLRYGLAGTVGFGVLTLSNIVSTTLLIWFASTGRSVLVVLPFCMGAWGSYLLSHYLVEGTFIDRTDLGGSDESDGPVESPTEPADIQDRNTSYKIRQKISGLTESGDSSPLPASRVDRVLAVVGLGGMFMTFPTGIIAVSQNNLGLLFVSATLFVVGYIVGHQGLTGKLL